MAINNKYLILFTLLGIIFLSHLSFATTETSVQNPVKLDSLINVHSTAVFASDSTIVKKSEYEPSSVIGFSFSLAAILSWGLSFFRALAQLQLIFNPVLLGIVGLLFSIIALVRIKKNKRKGKKLAKAGIILTILHALGLAGFIVLLMIAFSGHN
jgi:O-antigen ligase